MRNTASTRFWATLAVTGTGLMGSMGLVGCGSAPTVKDEEPSKPANSTAGGTDAGPNPSAIDTIPIQFPSSIVPVTSATAAGTSSQPAPSTCKQLGCGPGQRCDEGTDAGASCIDLECDDLTCDTTEKCAPHDLGGHVCVANSCDSSVECTAKEFCGDDGLCQADVCIAQALTCDGNSVLACDSAGGSEGKLFTCGSAAYFTSECTETSADSSGCSCEDDWDCPAFTTCEVGVCRGTGKAPSCTLPPLPFADTPPAVEIHWGGDAADNDEAHDGSPEKNRSPWASAAHVQSTPMVANLDDDNGDGLVNELDFPEIVFISYADGADSRGIVRAIHGGGPSKGKDYFAVCGSTTWTESNPIETPDADCNEPEQPRSRNTLAIGDLDRDGLPEIVFVTQTRALAILNNQGSLVYLSAAGFVEDSQPNTADDGSLPAIADLDLAGLAEVVIGRQVFVLGVTTTTAADGGAATQLIVTHRFTGTLDAVGMHNGTAFVNYPDGGVPPSQVVTSNMGPTSCVADLHPDPGMEILAGSTLYRLPELTECATPPCSGNLEVVWDAAALNPELFSSDGYCAVADVWGEDLGSAPGPNNPPDGNAEAILIADGHLEIFEGATGALILDRDLGGGALGGAPNVDDFDGDGFMEIGSALSDFMVVADLQEPSAACPAWPLVMPRILGGNDNPNLPAAERDPGGTCKKDSDCADGAVCNLQQAACVCLHNGWFRESDDDSSKVTSTSVFDFNGDGASEVLYNDECEFRVYDGANGAVLYSEISRSRTAMENPIVADVDNDGNAEVITALNTEENNRCDDDTGAVAGPNGLRVWGDPLDSWVSARRIWNQFAYHVTNVTESGAVPVHEPESWRPYNERLYNTYRSQPRSQGAAPDLQVTGLSLSSPDVACGSLGDRLDITFEITNAGDLRVGPGVQVSFYGTWDGTEEELQGPTGPLTFTLTGSLEPNHSVIATAQFDLLDQGQTELPTSVRAVVDTGGAANSDFGAERECIEDNNDKSAVVAAGEPRPDLSVQLGAATVACAQHTASVEVTVTNSGTADAKGIVLQIFAGDPSAGGTSMLVFPIPGTIKAGAESTFTVDVPGFPFGRSIVLWGVVDPENTIGECNEGDNKDPADNPIRCAVSVQT